MIRAFLLFTLLLASVGCSSGGDGSGKKRRPPPVQRVETVAVDRVEVARELVRNGSLRARRETKITTQEEGRVTELPYFEGDKVVRGDRLFTIDDTLLRAELKKLQAQQRQAQLDLKRLKRLQGSRAVSEEELTRARTALDVISAEAELLNLRLGHMRIGAPFAGVISQRLVEPGDVVARFRHLLTLIDPASLITEVTVSGVFLPQLKRGDRVTVTIDALGRTPFNGVISRLHPTVDVASRQGKVEVVLEPAPSGALPGQLCRVTLKTRPESRLLVPFSALQRDLQGEYLYRVADQKALRVAVISGAHFADQVEIVSGVSQGDQIVTKGLYDLTEGASIKVINRASGAGQAQQ